MISPLFDLRGKVALVTGASRGIGAAIARELALHGARVVVSSRKLDACQAVVDGIVSDGGEALAVACNIGRRQDLAGLVEAAHAAWGGIDILVCNAAVNPYYGPAIDMPDEAFAKVMDNNLRSNIWLSHMVLPGMADRGGGAVIIISSINGLRGSPRLGAYAISKAANMQLVRNLAVEWGPRNVRANCIAPGLVKTDFARALWENPEIARKRLIDTPLQRIGEPEHIAGAAVFLASGAGAFMTGQTLVIDGGVMAGSPATGDLV